jgi:hypothetical protein
LDKAKPDAGNMKGLNLAAVKHTTVQVTILPLCLRILRIGHNLLYLGQSESESHFTTGGLPPISSSWRQAP